MLHKIENNADVERIAPGATQLDGFARNCDRMEISFVAPQPEYIPCRDEDARARERGSATQSIEIEDVLELSPEHKTMKLSIVIICWNDLKVITDCLRSIFDGTHSTEFEVLVSDNGSTDGSVQFVRENYPAVKIVENGANLGFAKGNNAGIRQTIGDYVLI